MHIKKKPKPFFSLSNLIDDRERRFIGKRSLVFVLFLAMSIEGIAFLTAYLGHLVIHPVEFGSKAQFSEPPVDSQSSSTPASPGRSMPEPAALERVPETFSQLEPLTPPDPYHGFDPAMAIRPDGSNPDLPLSLYDLRQIKVSDVIVSPSKDDPSTVSIRGKIRNQLLQAVDRLVLIVYFSDDTGEIVLVKRFGLPNVAIPVDETVDFNKMVEVKDLPAGYKTEVEVLGGHHVFSGQ